MSGASGAVAAGSRVAVLGASGGVGRRVASRLLDRKVDLRLQTRRAERLGAFDGRAEVMAFEPRDAAALNRFVDAADAVVFALGVDGAGATTLFSEATSALIGAMDDRGVKRLVAITGVGAGDTRGHGGFVYDWIVFPLFTRRRYVDKDRQEALIAASDLDWTIVRPAPFSEKPAASPLQVVTEIRPETRLCRVTRDEVANFIVAELESARYVRQSPFVGHA